MFNIESGTSLIARDGPERSLTQIPANETITLNNTVPPSGASVFTWGPPRVPVVRDSVITTPEKKAPVGITIRDSCEVQTKNAIINTDESVKTTSERQEEATTAPQVSQKQERSYYKPAESTTSKKKEIGGKKHFQESSFDKVQINANKKRSDSEDATISKDLGKKRARTEPVLVTLCLCADDKQSGFKAQETIGSGNFADETSDHECRCIQPKERPDVEDCEHDTMTISKKSKMSSSSSETKRVEEDKSVSFFASCFDNNRLGIAQFKALSPGVYIT